MKVVLCPGDSGGCGWYRMRLPGGVLAAQGHDVSLLPEDQISGLEREDGTPVTVDLDADVVVLQRPMNRRLVDLIPVMQKQGTAVVVEVDDHFHAIPRDNQAWPGAQREWLPMVEAVDHFKMVIDTARTNGIGRFDNGTQGDLLVKQAFASCRRRDYDVPGGKVTSFYRIPEATARTHKGHLMAACRKADLVTVTTPALAEQYGKHGRVRVVPNCIPESWLKIPRPDNPKPVVGWTGVVGTHPGDLEAVGDGVKLAVETAGAIFRSVGNDHPANVLGIAGQRDVVPWVDFSDYPHQTSLLDVGIVPLAETPFNEAKSWLKGLEYAALGIPFVASPTGPYHALNREGAGVLAHGPHRWREALISLLTNRKVADEYGQHGRDTASRWTVEGNSWRWLEAWDRAVKLRGQW